jgi:hypothetical protein
MTAAAPLAYTGPWPIRAHRSIDEIDREQLWRRCMLAQAYELSAPVAVTEPRQSTPDAPAQKVILLHASEVTHV